MRLFNVCVVLLCVICYPLTGGIFYSSDYDIIIKLYDELNSINIKYESKITLDSFLDSVIAIEGGYVDNKYDTGGKTKYGITYYISSIYGYNDVNTITECIAKEIMTLEFWNGIGIDKIYNVGYESLAYFMLDFCINAGYNGVKELQKELNIDVDGCLGSKTVAEIKKYNERKLLSSMKQRRDIYYRSLDSFKYFGNGWTIRNEKMYTICVNNF